jgi:SagB-type dehydrogenase family enzyme
MTMTESIGKNFWEHTKGPHLPESDQRKGNVPQPPLELSIDSSARLIELPDPHGLDLPAADLWQAIETRKTRRSYAPTALTLEELSILLWSCQGVKRVTSRPVTLRTVPSAGARHPFETYLLINRVEGLQPGLYRYAAIEHALVDLDEDPELNQRITAACNDQNQVANSAVTFIWAAIVERMTWRYPERGYRYLLLDAGHVCQNLYLAAEALSCGVCAIAAYDDDQLNAVLGLDGEARFAAYVASLGKQLDR